MNSSGSTAIYRFVLGAFSGSVATQGRIIRFDDINGSGMRLEGVLMKQDTTAFTAASISGNYAFGEQGVDSLGDRIVSAGVFHADGVSSLSSFDLDSTDAVPGASNPTLDTNDTTGSGTYTVASNGRGTSTVTVQGTASHSVLYVVSSSEVLSMATDVLSQTTAIQSGETKKQTAPSFTQTSLDGKGYVFYALGIDPGNGGNDGVIGQATFTTNGNLNLTLDENDNGALNGNNFGAEQTGTGLFTVASNGRTTLSGSVAVAGNHPPVFYLIGTDSAFLVGTDNGTALGFVQEQVGSPFSTSSLSGVFATSDEAPTTGNDFSIFSLTFNGTGTLSGTQDSSSGSNGLQTNGTFSDTYSFATSSSPVGKGTIAGTGDANISYIVNSSQGLFAWSSNRATIRALPSVRSDLNQPRNSEGSAGNCRPLRTGPATLAWPFCACDSRAFLYAKPHHPLEEYAEFRDFAVCAGLCSCVIPSYIKELDDQISCISRGLYGSPPRSIDT